VEEKISVAFELSTIDKESVNKSEAREEHSDCMDLESGSSPSYAMTFDIGYGGEVMTENEYEMSIMNDEYEL
jgi:hypothetical protein